MQHHQQQRHGAAAAAAAAAAAQPKIELIDNTVVPGATRIVDECYNYSDADQIGEGTYGKVYRGTDKRGQRVALKMLRMENEKEGFPITAIREIKLLSTLKHENIVNLREIVRSRVTRESKYKCDIYMVFDYAEHDLTGLMETTKTQQLRPDQIKCIMHQLLRGLSYCHSNGILHRDLKASNLLINRQGVLKIADFGLARSFNEEINSKLTNRVITLWYRPPELLLGSEQYGPEVDVWSVGCIFAELLTHKPLFPGSNEINQLDCILKMMGAPTEKTWPGVSKLKASENIKKEAYRQDSVMFDEWCKRQQLPADAVSLLKAMLQLDPAKRISAIDATLHDYFYNSDVKMCEPHQLPRLPDCHEWTTKKRKHQQQHPGHRAHSHPQQQQQQHGSGPGHSYMSGHMPPHQQQFSSQQSGHTHYAAAGQQQQPGVGAYGDRGVRPRQDMGGYRPGGSAPMGAQGYGGGYRPPGAGGPPGAAPGYQGGGMMGMPPGAGMPPQQQGYVPGRAPHPQQPPQGYQPRR